VGPTGGRHFWFRDWAWVSQLETGCIEVETANELELGKFVGFSDGTKSMLVNFRCYGNSACNKWELSKELI